MKTSSANSAPKIWAAPTLTVVPMQDAAASVNPGIIDNIVFAS